MGCSDLQYDNVAIVHSEVDSDDNVASSRTSNVAGEPVSRNEFESEAEKIEEAHLSDEDSSSVIKPCRYVIQLYIRVSVVLT